MSFLLVEKHGASARERLSTRPQIKELPFCRGWEGGAQELLVYLSVRLFVRQFVSCSYVQHCLGNIYLILHLFLFGHVCIEIKIFWFIRISLYHMYNLRVLLDLYKCMLLVYCWNLIQTVKETVLDPLANLNAVNFPNALYGFLHLHISGLNNISL